MELKLISSVIILLSSIEHVASKGCCRAKQYETSYVGTIWASSNDSSDSRVFYRGGFDFKKRRYGKILYYEDLDLTYQTYQFFGKGEQYGVIDGVCAPIYLEEPNRCVREDSDLVGSYFIGGGALLVDSWRKTVSGKGLFYDWSEITTRKECAPVQENKVFLGNEIGEPVFLQYDGNFMNYSKGIKEPDRWFKLPLSCYDTNVKMANETFGPLKVREVLRGLFL